MEINIDTNYTIAEWMSGVAPPDSKSKVKKYVYGIGITVNEKLVIFAKKEGKKHPKDLIKIVEEHEIEASIEDIKLHQAELYLKYKDSWAQELELKELKKQEEEIYKSRLGRIAIHSDAAGTHKAIILVPELQTFALFLTSHPGWAKKSRLLTDYERNLCGLINDYIPTFFAPVLRPLNEFSFMERQFSESRVIDLLNEFSRNDAC